MERFGIVASAMGAALLSLSTRIQTPIDESKAWMAVALKEFAHET